MIFQVGPFQTKPFYDSIQVIQPSFLERVSLGSFQPVLVWPSDCSSRGQSPSCEERLHLCISFCMFKTEINLFEKHRARSTSQLKLLYFGEGAMTVCALQRKYFVMRQRKGQ